MKGHNDGVKKKQEDMGKEATTRTAAVVVVGAEVVGVGAIRPGSMSRK